MCFDESTMESVKSSLLAKSSSQFLLSAPVEKTRTTKSCTTNKASKCELVDYDSLPEFLKHNQFIINYYRSEWPLKQTMLSIFSIHNETLNIWTHLIGFFIFLILAGYAASAFPVDGNGYPLLDLSRSGNSSNGLFALTHISNQTTEIAYSRWPFYVFLAGAMFCLLMSSACHLLSCHCYRTSYIMLRLDFAGISGLIVSSFYPIVYYSFTCSPFIRDLYLALFTIFGLVAVGISLVPVFDSPKFRPVRAGLFASIAASVVVPIAHKMVAFGDRPEAVLTTRYEALMMLFYGVGVVVYAARVPERWLPGKFDLAGHSHQLFHMVVVAGAYTHYLASLVYLRWRETEGC